MKNKIYIFVPPYTSNIVCVYLILRENRNEVGRDAKKKEINNNVFCVGPFKYESRWQIRVERLSVGDIHSNSLNRLLVGVEDIVDVKK